MDLKVQKMLAETVANANKNTISPYTTTAEVTSITGDTVYVKIPGSENSTPVKARTVSVKVGDIVDLSVSHSDTRITGNRSDVAVAKTTTDAIASDVEANRLLLDNEIEMTGNKIKAINNDISLINNNIDIQNSKIETIDSTVKTHGSNIESLNSTIKTHGSNIESLNSTIKTHGSNIESLNSTIKTHGSNIESLNSDVKIINSAFIIKDGKLTGISEIITGILDVGYVTTDLLNANVGWIENGKIKEGAIGTVEIADSSITTAKIKELSADTIKTGTLKTECLILTTDEVDPETGEKKVALITALNAKTKAGEGNILDGAVIADDTITASKITVVDLNAFGATIGNFNIGTSSMYNGKTRLTDPTNGVYVGTDGIALGQGSLLDMTDDSPFRIESDGDFHLGGKDSNYINFDPFKGELKIDAKDIKMGSSSIATVKNVNDAKDSIKIGGRNLFLGTKDFSVGTSNVTGIFDLTNKIGAFTVLKAKCPTDRMFYDPFSQKLEYEPNTQYTLSFYAKADSTCIVDSFFYNIGNEGTYKDGFTQTAIGNKWKKYVITWTTGDTARLASVIPIRLQDTKDVWVYMYAVKFEEGNKATDWTPAPEDVENDATTKANNAKSDAISAVNETLKKYATLEVTNDKISSAVTESKAYTDAIEIGGRNLARQTAESKTWSSTSENGDDTWIDSDGGSGWLPTIPIEPNQAYTLSFDYTLQNCNDESIGVGIGAGAYGTNYTKDLWNLCASYKQYGGSITSGHFVYNLSAKDSSEINDAKYFAFRPIRRLGSEGDTTPIILTISNFKLEAGNKPTDWTPAPEDVENDATTKANNAVTEAKSYVDQTAESIKSTVQDVNGRLTTMEQNASGFTWSIDETAIISSVNEYYKSTSATSLSGGLWSESQPTWSEGTYIWMRTKNTNGKGTVSYTTAVCITGNTGSAGEKGDPGTPGKDGKGISGTTVTYQAGSSGTSAPTGEWSSSVPSTTADKPYLWTKTVITYADNTESTSYSVGSTPEGIVVGGRNLILNSYDRYSNCSFLGSGNSFDIITTTCPDQTNGKVVRITTSASTDNNILRIRDVVQTNGTYTLSVWCKSAESTHVDNVEIDICDYGKTFVATTSWQRQTLTVTVTNQSTIYQFVDFEVPNGHSVLFWHPKLEKGNKATDWTPAPEDIVADATNKANEAAKTATDYMRMNFSGKGLTIGNLKESTLGKNVLIDSDSVDIRNGSAVLASYGEDISLYKNGISAFTVRNSEFLNYAVNVGNNFAIISVDEDNKYVTASSPSSTPVTFNNGEYYKWKFTYKSKEIFVVFAPSTTYSEVTQIVWREDESNILYIINNNSSVTEPCVYLDENAVVDLILKGSVRIDNSGDIHGKIKGAPPLSIGTNDGVHLEIDGDEIAAKYNDTTPSSLYLNAEGGGVSINENCNRSFRFQSGILWAKKNSGSYAGKWIEIIDAYNDAYITAFGYGNYVNNIGLTNIYGYKINIFSKGAVVLQSGNDLSLTVGDGANNISANTNFVVSNSKGFVGTNKSGDLRNNIQPCDADNKCVIGYDSYTHKEGATNIYGDYLSLTTNLSHIMNNKAMSIPAISVHSVTTQVLRTSAAVIAVSNFDSTYNQTTIGSTYFKITGSGVRCLLSGWIKVSAQISLTGLNTNDGVYLYIYKNSTEMYSTYARLNSSGELSIIDHVLKVEADDVIYIYARNITAARGTITNDWYGASLTIAYVN